MNQNEQPPKETSTPTADEIARQRRARLAAATTPPSSGYSGQRERYTPPVDYPLQPCDFKRQMQFDSLPIEQACFVLLGFEPPPLHVLKFVQDTYNPSQEPTWDEPPDYQDVLRSLRLSIELGNVSAQRSKAGRYATKHVSWPELVQWARSKSYAIAPELESIVPKKAPVDLAAPESQAAPVLPDGASGGVVPASDGPAPIKTKQNKRQTWQDVTWPYLESTFNAGQYRTAKEFYKALENKAGADSPFDKGTDTHRGSLYVRETSESISLKTVQNQVWPKLKESR